MERMKEYQNWVLENWMTWGLEGPTDEHERDSEGHKNLKGQRVSEHIVEHDRDSHKDSKGQRTSKYITKYDRDSKE